MDFIRINSKDNVAVALKDLSAGYVLKVDGIEVVLKTSLDRGHKFALSDISSGENVIKYGLPIGHAVSAIERGDHVHTHNLKTNLGNLLEYSYDKKVENFTVSVPNRKINVYRRFNGDIGIRNELWIIPTVGCVNGVCERIRNEFLRKYSDSPEGSDGVFVFSHDYGCSQLGEDHLNTRTILQDMVRHPNAGGVLVVGLGCENNQVSSFMDSLGEHDTDRVMTLIAQDVDDEVSDGVEKLSKLYSRMKNDRREITDISALRIGLECGGSDSFSGITANPLLGELSNYMLSYGGTTVLTEVPEMFGAEIFLMERAADLSVFNKIVSLINDFKDYFIKHDQVIYENPSPGNKKGGITTLEEKSLGAVEKSGKGEVTDVLKYGETIHGNGLFLLSAPGNDLVATTALAAAGCHIVIFTTGRGTPFGGPVPTIKVSTNSELFRKKQNWIDFNAGELAEGMKMDSLLSDFTVFIAEVASGKQVLNEINGTRGMSIFKNGVTL